MQSSYKEIGTFINTHGIKGEIRVFSKMDLSKVLEIKKKIFIGSNEFVIKSFRPHKKVTLITLEGIENINDIENLKGNKVYYDIEVMEDHAPIKYIGLDVVEDDVKIGEVIDFYKQASYYSLIVKMNDETTINIPMVEEIMELENNKVKVKQKGLY